MRKNLKPQAAVIAVLSLVLTACGARVDDGVRQQAADVALNGGGGGGGAGGGAVGEEAVGGGTGPAAGGLTGGTSGGTSGGTTTGGGGGGGAATGGKGATGGKAATGGKGGGAAAPAGGTGGATDSGVTATSITVGSVSDQSGPVPGLFAGSPYGADAYFEYINSQGGIYGRQLRLQVADSQTDCGANKNAHTNLVSKVFAFVGSFSLYDNCGSPVLDAKPGTVDLSYALSPAKKASKTSYAVQPAPMGYPNGMFTYFAKKYGNKVKKVGSLCPNIPSAVESHKMIRNAAESAGWEWIYDETHGATESRFDTYLFQMQRQGVEVLFEVCENAANAASMKKQADSQGWKPVFVFPIAYASDFIERIGSPAAAEGIVGYNLYSLFFNKDEAKTIPELALYQEWMAKANPGAALDLYSMYSWAGAKLFVEALKKAGPKATRASLLAAVKGIGTFDAGGIISPGNPGAKTPSQCYVLWQIKGGKFIRTDTPAGKYRCDGKYINYR